MSLQYYEDCKDCGERFFTFQKLIKHICKQNKNRCSLCNCVISLPKSKEIGKCANCRLNTKDRNCLT